ncbi:NAD(P)/FAD-dependent oxidoreductase [Fictibacillus iocasae]|uniref:NAD(P)/FAD-dependent oxidoreductase n=1 Tax=Fictibacillus iocasae TaxID=2715437 RepID=A0ABW2NQC1_9BACL
MMRDERNGVYWPSTYNHEMEYPALTENESCDVLIVGGGMTGALCAHTLAKDTNLDVVLIDRKKTAYGSTPANNGILKFSSDKMLHELIREIGTDDAVYFYEMCQESLKKLSRLALDLNMGSDYRIRNSLYYASTAEDAVKVAKEYEALHHYGFPVHFVKEKDMLKYVPFHKPGAILTEGDADMNPFRFAQEIVKSAAGMGVRVYEETPLLHKSKGSDYFIIDTGRAIIRAKTLLFATGYDNDFLAQQFGANLNRSYAVITEPVPAIKGWNDKCMIWETNRPYLYMRTTADNRIIAGGLDEDKLEEPIDDQLIGRKADRLLKKINEMFPDVKPVLAQAWYTTSGESHDGLPYIGEHPNNEGEYYCLGFGGNRTLYSMIGAEVIKELLTKGSHTAEKLFSLSRVPVLQ